MLNNDKIIFIDNKAASSGEKIFVEIIVNVPAVLKSWQQSLYSFEWLDETGAIKPFEELPENEQKKLSVVQEKMKNKEPLEKPILGIGIMDNIEIGSGRVEFLTLAAQGYKTMPVHILKSNEKDLKPFLADIGS